MDPTTAILAGVAAADIIALCSLCFFVARLSARVTALTRATAESMAEQRARSERETACIEQRIDECLQRKDVSLLRQFLFAPTLAEDFKSFTQSTKVE